MLSTEEITPTVTQIKVKKNQMIMLIDVHLKYILKTSNTEKVQETRLTTIFHKPSFWVFNITLWEDIFHFVVHVKKWQSYHA